MVAALKEFKAELDAVTLAHAAAVDALPRLDPRKDHCKREVEAAELTLRHHAVWLGSAREHCISLTKHWEARYDEGDSVEAAKLSSIVEACLSGDMEAKLRVYFDAVDRDGDGKITVDQIADLVTELTRAIEETVDTTFIGQCAPVGGSGWSGRRKHKKKMKKLRSDAKWDLKYAEKKRVLFEWSNKQDEAQSLVTFGNFHRTKVHASALCSRAELVCARARRACGVFALSP